MNDDALLKIVDRFFAYHKMESSPCTKCANLRLKRPGNPYFCIRISREEWREKYWRSDAEQCPFFEEGRLQLID